ncbi:DUF6250 domain-containing protein [Bradyrhizobium oligotrophicum]|uniref:DUF6250 domain-containing protein n=1 Tax=Bradyrhizobium oligotrophicum TaxID=44255 RepID=UPI003EB9D93F
MLGDIKTIESWAPIFGHWQFEGGAATFLGPTGHLPVGVCVSNERFSEGRAQFVAEGREGELSARILFGYRSPTSDYYLVGLGGHGAAYTVVRYSTSSGWRLVAAAGQQEYLMNGREYRVAVEVEGQQISLEVDGIRVLEATLPDPLLSGQVGLFAWDNEVRFKDVEISRKPGDVFVVMQFSGFEELYKDVIKPVTEGFGLRPYRADEVYGPGSIIADISNGIERAQIVIAEITPSNENVFYEVGYAHGIRKPTIILAEKNKKLPFDLSGFRCLFYENSIGGKAKVEEGLKNHLRAILAD